MRLCPCTSPPVDENVLATGEGRKVSQGVVAAIVVEVMYLSTRRHRAVSRRPHIAMKEPSSPRTARPVVAVVLAEVSLAVVFHEEAPYGVSHERIITPV